MTEINSIEDLDFEHYGVKGMKWGVRKRQPTTHPRTSSPQKKSKINRLMSKWKRNYNKKKKIRTAANVEKAKNREIQRQAQRAEKEIQRQAQRAEKQRRKEVATPKRNNSEDYDRFTALKKSPISSLSDSDIQYMTRHQDTMSNYLQSKARWDDAQKTPVQKAKDQWKVQAAVNARKAGIRIVATLGANAAKNTIEKKLGPQDPYKAKQMESIIDIGLDSVNSSIGAGGGKKKK